MAMSDCPKCWDTPCSCGWELRHFSIVALTTMKLRIEKAIEFKKAHRDARFSSVGQADTHDDGEFMRFIKS